MMREIERKKRITEMIVFIERLVIAGLVLLLITKILDSPGNTSPAAATYIILPEGKGDVAAMTDTSEVTSASTNNDEIVADVEETIKEEPVQEEESYISVDEEPAAIQDTQVMAEHKKQYTVAKPISNEKHVVITTTNNEAYVEVTPISNDKQVVYEPLDTSKQVNITPIGDDRNQVDITPIGGDRNQVVITQ